MILKLKGANGLPVLVNTEHVMFVDTPSQKPENGNGRPLIMIGKAVLVFVGGANIIVDHGVQDIADMLGGDVRVSALRDSLK